MRILLATLTVAAILSVAPSVAGAAGIFETPLYFSPLTAAGSTELQVPREAFVGVPIFGEVLIAGGHQGGSILSSAELFDPYNDTFNPLPHSMQAARSNVAATTVGFQEVLLAGGWNGSAMRSAELFEPEEGSIFTTLAHELQTARADAVAAPLPNGGALIAGGYDGSSDLQSAELFSRYEGGGTFTTLPHPMNTPRAGAVAAALPDGEVLIAGGGNESSGSLQSAELFNPTDETFTTLEESGDHELQTAREYATAASLPDGEILIAGGYNESSGQLQSAEVFDPDNDTFTALPASGMSEQQVPRAGAIAAPLSNNGLVLIAGGFGGSGTLQSAELVYPGPQVTGGEFGATTRNLRRLTRWRGRRRLLGPRRRMRADYARRSAELHDHHPLHTGHYRYEGSHDRAVGQPAGGDRSHAQRDRRRRQLRAYGGYRTSRTYGANGIYGTSGANRSNGTDRIDRTDRANGIDGSNWSCGSEWNRGHKRHKRHKRRTGPSRGTGAGR